MGAFSRLGFFVNCVLKFQNMKFSSSHLTVCENWHLHAYAGGL